MRTIEILLSDDEARFVARRIEEGGFGSASEYSLGLVRRDCEPSEPKRRLDELIHEGLASGEPIEMTEEWWKTTKADLASRLEERRPD